LGLAWHGIYGSTKVEQEKLRHDFPHMWPALGTRSNHRVTVNFGTLKPFLYDIQSYKEPQVEEIESVFGHGGFAERRKPQNFMEHFRQMRERMRNNKNNESNSNNNNNNNNIVKLLGGSSEGSTEDEMFSSEGEDL
jgi:hypothetical protein